MRFFQGLVGGNKDEAISNSGESGARYGALGTQQPAPSMTKEYNAIVTEVSNAIEAHGGYLRKATTPEDSAVIANQILMLEECMTALRRKGGQVSITTLRVKAEENRGFVSYFRNETGFFADMARKVGVNINSSASAIVDRVIKYLEDDLRRVTDPQGLSAVSPSLTTRLLSDD